MSSGVARDEFAIHNLIARMAHATDRGSLDDYGEILHDNARWVMPASEPVIGRDAIVAGAAARRAASVSGPGSDCLHLVSSVAVIIDGDRAAARSYWSFVNTVKHPPEIRSAGRYEDTFVRDDGRWLFAERVSTRS